MYIFYQIPKLTQLINFCQIWFEKIRVWNFTKKSPKRLDNWKKRYRKVASSGLSWLVAHFQTVYEGEFWCLCTVTFGQNGPKLNRRPVDCSYISFLLWKNLRMVKFSALFWEGHKNVCLFLTEQAWSHGGLQTRELGQDPSHVSMGD